MTTESGPLYYWDYLQLDRVLDAQSRESTKHGPGAHDEMLFIIVHQAFELWFKEILWELDAVLDIVGGDVIPEKAMGQVVSLLGRITQVQRLLVDQLDVLETMTPLDFLDFRDYLIPASGFQSVQFRLIENKLGLMPRYRLKIKGAAYTTDDELPRAPGTRAAVEGVRPRSYTDVLSDEHTALLEASETQPSLLDHVERWLERTPFLHFGEFDFWSAYRQAVERMLAKDRQVIVTHPNIDEDERAAQLALFRETEQIFEALFDLDRYAELVARGKRRLSHRAFLAALLISLYRDEPIFQLPFRVLTSLMDIDEGFTAWRYRHALLAHRMIGGRIGTGGTSGPEYLQAAAAKHRVFRDLFDLATFFIPRSELPRLPDAVREQMSFRYTSS